MWETTHGGSTRDDAGGHHFHMASSERIPSTLAPDNSYYMSQHLVTGDQGMSHQAYSASLPATGSWDGPSRFHNQPRSFYKVQNDSSYYPGGYTQTTPTTDLGGSTGVPTVHPNRAQSNNFHALPVTLESEFANPVVNSYGYIYTPEGHQPPQPQHHQANLIPTTTRTTPTLSPPPSVHATHKRHIKQAPRTAPRRPLRHHRQGLSPESISSTSPSHPQQQQQQQQINKSKLRSASRTSKNTHHNPPATVEERRSRETHNNVEKQYRNRLNAHFESLLSALPESMQIGEEGHGRGGEGDLGGGGGGQLTLDSSSANNAAAAADRRVSKAEVLDMARRHIKALERECVALEGERDELRDSLERFRWLFGRCEGGNGPAGGGDGAGAAASSRIGSISDGSVCMVDYKLEPSR